MHHHRRRKKRHIHGLRTVEVTRGKSGYGFTISGQQPCILSCIVSGSPADCVGLKTGDYLMGVNGLNISSAPHDDVVRMIGSSSGLLVLQIAENYNGADSSEDEFANRPKTKYPNRKTRQLQTQSRASDDAFVPYSSERMVGHGAGIRHGGRKPYDQHRQSRSRSPGMELDRADFHQSRSHHQKLRGVENIYPHHNNMQNGMQKSQRHKHPLPPPACMPMPNCEPQSQRTKHTIITREHRLGISSSRDRERFRMPVGAEAVPEGRMTPRDLSSILYPSIQPHIASRQQMPESLDGPSLMPFLGDSTKAVVGYVGSIEMPRDSRLPSSSLQSVRSAVRRLRVEKKIHTLVLMEVVMEGVRLVNQMSHEVAVYPAEKVAFSGTCPDDRRFFGIVTQHGLSMEEINVDSTIDESVLGSSCHVFMVDPDLAPHSVHVNKARHFGLRCTPNPQMQECLEFPLTPNRLLQCVAQLYEDRQADLYTPGQAEGAPLQRNSQRSDSTSSNGADSGLGFGREHVEQIEEPACVVEVCNDPGQQSMQSSDASARWDSENSGSAFVAVSSLSESQSLTGNDTSFLSMASHDRYPATGSADPLSFTSGTSFNTTDASQSSHNMSTMERLNPRATLNSGGWSNSGLSRQFSSSNLLDAQNSANNLRWNAHRIMQKHMETARPQAGEGDPSRASDCSQNLPEHGQDVSSNTWPRTQEKQPARSSSSCSNGKENSPHDEESEAKPKLEPRTFLAPGPLAGSRRPKPPPIPASMPTVPSSSSSEPNSRTPIAMPTSKPPLPERRPMSGRAGPRTPVNPPRMDLYRPKSTPPMRMRESSVVGLPLMEQEEGGSDIEDVSSILESFESWPWSNLPGEKPVDDHADNRRHSDGHNLKRLPEKGGPLKLTKASSFRQLKQSAVRSSLSNSHESLVINDSHRESTGKYEKLGGATSLAVIGNKGSFSNDSSPSCLVGRAASWAVCFDKLLQDGAGVATFTEFLKKEFSEENMLFWIKCESYRNITDLKERKSEAADMFERHLSPCAMEAVNVDSHAQSLAQKGVEEAASDLFEVAQRQIHQLMKTDSYPRFLKSDLYKQCVMAEMEGKRLPYGDDDVPLPDKRLKKSKSSCSADEPGGEERRRRSLLPWNRNKEKGERRLSKMPTDPDMRQKVAEAVAAANNKERSLSGSGTAKSSLDLADLSLISKEVQATKAEDQRDGQEVAPQDQGSKESHKFCRVTLPDGSTTVIYAGGSQSVRAALGKLCDRRKLSLVKLEVVFAGTDKWVDLSKDIISLGSKEIKLSSRALFQLDLPGRKSVVVRSSPDRSTRDALKPVLVKYGLKLEGMVVNLFGTGKSVDQDSEVSTLAGQRVTVQSLEDFTEWGGLGFTRNHSTKGSSQKSSSDGGPGDLLKTLLEGGADSGVQFDELGVWDPEKKHDDKTRPDNRGSVFGFMRRNSVGEKEGNKLKSKARAMFGNSQRHPAPIKGIPPRSSRLDADEERFLELLSRAQSRTMDDQRGLKPADFELPDFLKVEAGGEYGSRPKLRRTELHNSDSSIYESAMDESRLSRSRSQEKLPLPRQFEDSKSMRSVGSYGSPQKIPFMDQSFSNEGVVPSHFDAEDYFSQSQIAGYSPDYNNSRLMDRSLRDIGLGLNLNLNTSKLSQRSDGSNDARATTPISLLPNRLSPRVKTPEVPPRLPPKPRVPRRQQPPGEKKAVSLASEEELDATLLPSPVELHPPTTQASHLPRGEKHNSATHLSSNHSQSSLHQHAVGFDESEAECDIALGLRLDGCRDESTPSPTTHDLVLDSSPDTEDSPRILPPKPTVRTSLVNMHSSSNFHQRPLPSEPATQSTTRLSSVV